MSTPKPVVQNSMPKPKTDKDLPKGNIDNKHNDEYIRLIILQLEIDEQNKQKRLQMEEDASQAYLLQFTADQKSAQERKPTVNPNVTPKVNPKVNTKVNANINPKINANVNTQVNPQYNLLANENDDAGYALALSLHEQEQANKSRRRRQKEDEESAVLAHSMQYGDEAYLSSSDVLDQFMNANARWRQKQPSNIDFKSAKDDKQDSEKLKAMEVFKQYKQDTIALLGKVRVHPAVAGNPNPKELMDAHAHTKTYIRSTIPELVKIDNHFSLSDPNLSAETVLAEVKAFLDESLAEGNRMALFAYPTEAEKNAREAQIAKNTKEYQTKMSNINTTFSKIKGSVIDDETQAHIAQFLSRNWSIAKTLGKNYKFAIAWALNDNIGDKGGCTAGLIARLFSTYAINLVTLLAPTLINPKEKEADNAKAKITAQAPAPATATAAAPATASQPAPTSASAKSAAPSTAIGVPSKR